jgi:predicted amidohydrolase YtcJ
MRNLRANVVLVGCVIAAASCNLSFAPQRGAASSAKADVVLLNGDILTGEGLGSGSPHRVSALAVRNGVVVAIGADEEISKLRGPKTEVIDLRGAFAMPGFNDAHLHLASGGFEKLNVDLVGVKSLAEMKDRIAARVKSSSPGEWMRGRGWDHTK